MGVLKTLKKFYMDMQQNESRLKQKIKNGKDWKEKGYNTAVLVIRSAVIVLFAILFVSLLSALFGSENSSLAVVMLVTLMTLRFVHFSYNIRDALLTFAVVMLIYLFVPSIALIAPTWSVFFIHFFAILILLTITTQKPQMGLGGLFGFSYSYLVGNAVEGTDLVLRAGMAVVCYIFIAAIMIYKHRNKDRKVRFGSLLRNFSLRNRENLWRLRLALGVALALTLGRALNIPRYMWMAFACSSILAKYPPSVEATRERLYQRVEGAAIGSTLFCILCYLIPSSMYSMIGVVSGFVLGFCSNYRSKTVVIAFGALSIAVGIYGVVDATLLRVICNVLGALLALSFAFLFDRILTRNLLPKEKTA